MRLLVVCTSKDVQQARRKILGDADFQHDVGTQLKFYFGGGLKFDHEKGEMVERIHIPQIGRDEGGLSPCLAYGLNSLDTLLGITRNQGRSIILMTGRSYIFKRLH